MAAPCPALDKRPPASSDSGISPASCSDRRPRAALLRALPHDVGLLSQPIQRVAVQDDEVPARLPGRFAGELHARGWLQDFFGWHNDAHHHSSLALFTPADVFFDRVTVAAAIRQVVLDLAYAATPERFTHGAPRVALPPAAVHINPLTADALSVLPAASAGREAPQSSIENTRSPRLAALRRPALSASIAT